MGEEVRDAATADRIRARALSTSSSVSERALDPAPRGRPPRRASAATPLLLHDRERRSSASSAPARRVDDDLADVEARDGVGERRGHRLQALRALAEALLLVEEEATLERLSALRHHRLQPPPLAFAQLVPAGTRAGARRGHLGGPQRQRYPAPRSTPEHDIGEQAISALVSAHTGSPLANVRATGTSASRSKPPHEASSYSV